MSADSLAAVPSDQVAAIAELWRRERREIVASFGGISMLPTIAPGTPLRVRCGDAFGPGDIILFLQRGEIVVHRLLSRRGRWLLTRGDGNAVPDRAIRSDAVVGRVIAIERDGTTTPVPSWPETVEQQRLRSFITFLLMIGAPLARLARPLLWQWRHVVDAWRRVGLPGVAARLWSRTAGLIVDVDLVLTYTRPTGVPFTRMDGYRYARLTADSPLFPAACRLLNVDPKMRRDQQAFVLIAPDGTVASCAMIGTAIAETVTARGTAVDTRFRGRGLGPEAMRYQAYELAAQGAKELDYHVGITNRASRRMVTGIGARCTERWIIVTLLRRFRFAKRWSGAAGR